MKLIYKLKKVPAPWLIVGFSLLVHLPGITSPLLDYHAYRQCQTASMARNYVRSGMAFLNPQLDTEGTPVRAGTEFPVYSYLLALLFKHFGMHDIWGRILSAIFGAWGAIYLYLFVRPRLGEARARMSALVMCVIPIHIYFTRSVQPEPMALWGMLGFLFYLDRWLNRGVPLSIESGGGTYRTPPHVRYGEARDWILALLLGATAPLLKLPFLYLIFPLGVVLGWDRFGRRVIRSGPLLLLAGGILALTAAWYHYAKTAPVGVLPLTSKEHWDNLRPIFTLELWKDHFLSRQLELCLTYPGLLFAAAGAAALHREKALKLWGLWWAATALYIVLLGQYGHIHRYTELPFAPVNAVLIASGIYALWQRMPHPVGRRGDQTPLSHTGEGPAKRGVRLFIGILVLGIPLHAGLRIKHWYQLEYPWVFRARAVVDGLMKDRAELLITNTREHPVLLYQLNRYGFAPCLEETGLDVLKDYQARGAQVFLTPTSEGWGRHPEWAPIFARRAELLHHDPDYLIYRLAPRR